MNHKKRMRIFWLSLCLLLVSGTVIIAVVQYRSHKREAEADDQVQENMDQGLQTEPSLETDTLNDGLAKDQDQAADPSREKTQTDVPTQPASGNTVRYQFELKENNGYLDVYYYHTQTLFLHTGIPYSTLTMEQKQELMDGKYFLDEQALYGYLESCTS